MIPKNQVLRGVSSLLKKSKGTGTSTTHRFLGVDEHREFAALIDLCPKRKHGNVKTLPLSTLEEALELGKVEPVTVPTSTKVTEGVTQFQEAAWTILQPFHSSPKTDYLFDCHVRAQLIALAASQSGASGVRVRYLLRRFLQGGYTKSGLRCNYVNCGTPANGTRALGSRMGRPSRLARLGFPSKYCPITPEVAELFLYGIKTHIMGPRNRNVSREESFNRVLFDFFRHEIETPEGEKALVFNDPVPTIDQFNYFIKKTFRKSQLAASRKTSAGHGTSGRSKTSETRSLTPLGPGDIYIIDSTPIDLNLVASSEGRRVVGRPRLYYVIDAWSQMIVAFHVTFGEACYEEAICALLNVLESKEELCRSLNIPYRASDWPRTGLPTLIIADRQEFIYGNSDLIHDRLGIHLINATAFRGDLKGLVEAALGFSMRKLWSLPGASDPKRGKDETDTLENAIFNLYESKRIILKEVIRLNRRCLKDISIPRQFLDSEHGKFGKVPCHLYAWGTEYISGTQLTGDIEEVRNKLLPLVTSASCNTDGIRVSAAGVNNIVYRDTDRKLPKELFEEGGQRQLKVQYDSRTMDVVYVEHPYTGEIIRCYLSRRRRQDYVGLTWAQGKAYQDREALAAHQGNTANLKVKAEDYDDQVRMTNTAIDRALGQGVVTRAHVKKHLKVVRQEEREAELEAKPVPKLFPALHLVEDFD